MPFGASGGRGLDDPIDVHVARRADPPNDTIPRGRGVDTTQVNCRGPLSLVHRVVRKDCTALRPHDTTRRWLLIPKGFKTVAGGKPHRSGATTGFERRNGPTILKGLQIVLYPAVRSAIPSALDRFVGACNPVVRYRDHRLISEAPFGANSLRVRTPAMI